MFVAAPVSVLLFFPSDVWLSCKYDKFISFGRLCSSFARLTTPFLNGGLLLPLCVCASRFVFLLSRQPPALLKATELPSGRGETPGGLPPSLAGKTFTSTRRGGWRSWTSPGNGSDVSYSSGRGLSDVDVTVLLHSAVNAGTRRDAAFVAFSQWRRAQSRSVWMLC